MVRLFSLWRIYIKGNFKTIIDMLDSELFFWRGYIHFVYHTVQIHPIFLQEVRDFQTYFASRELF